MVNKFALPAELIGKPITKITKTKRNIFRSFDVYTEVFFGHFGKMKLMMLDFHGGDVVEKRGPG